MSTKPTKQIDDGGPAFPQPMIQHEVHGPIFPESIASGTGGMSHRDWLAGKALQGLLVNYDTHGLTVPQCVGLALDAADAMIAALKGGAQ